MRDVWTAMERGEVVLGHWVASGSPAIAEAAARAGADLVAIDCEHGPIAPLGAELEACIRAVDAGGAAPVVRVAAQDGSEVSRALDLGARGVIVPHVTTAEQLGRLIAHARFPPAGIRGCHPAVRVSGYGAVPWDRVVGDAASAVAVVPLLEDPEAFDRLDELLAVDGLRAVAFGGFDLAARLGGVGDPGAEAQVARLRERLVAGCAARGVAVIDGAHDAADVRAKVAAGCRGILFGVDVAVVAAAVRRQVAQLRDDVEAVAS